MIFRKSQVLNQCQTTSINCKPYKCSILKIIYFAFLLSRKDPNKFDLLYTRLEFCTMGGFYFSFCAPKIGTQGHIDFVLSLSVIPSLFHSLICLRLHLANYFWTVSPRALIFHTSIPSNKMLSLVPTFFSRWPWPWSLTYFLKNVNLANNFWTVNSRALIFHMSIALDIRSNNIYRDLGYWHTF